LSQRGTFLQCKDCRSPIIAPVCNASLASRLRLAAPRRNSGDYIGYQIVRDHRDLVFELEFALLKPRHLQLIACPRSAQRIDRSIKVAMLDPEHLEALFQLLFVHSQPPSFRRAIAAANRFAALLSLTRFAR
jgi:hypothetical protein